MKRPKTPPSRGHLPGANVVARWAPPEKCEIDPETGIVIGPLPSAFELNEKEEGLSVTWVDYFFGGEEERQSSAFQAMYNSIGRRDKNGSFTPSIVSNGVVALGTVNAVLANCAKEGAPAVKAIHRPGAYNHGHPELRDYPRGIQGVLDAMCAVALTKHFAGQAIIDANSRNVQNELAATS